MRFIVSPRQTAAKAGPCRTSGYAASRAKDDWTRAQSAS